MSNLTAVKQAKWHADHKQNYDRDAKRAAVIELAEWKLFSNNQISNFTGMGVREVGAITGKTDRTGGALTAEALAPIIHLIGLEARGEVDDLAVKRAVDAGASTLVIATLTGIPSRTVARRASRFAA